MALGQLSGPRLPPVRGEATHLVVLAHGYGADGNDLIGLAPHWQRLLPTVAFVSPNAPVRQIWVSAMSKSYKLSWSPEAGAFALDGETLPKLLDRLARTFLQT